MTFVIVPFRRVHLDQMDEQAVTRYLRPHLSVELLESWERSPHCFTALHDGQVVGCGGIHDYYPGTPRQRGEAFAILDGSRSRRAFPVLFRAMARILRQSGFRRIEAVVDEGFTPGHRLAFLLGFQVETRDTFGRPAAMRGYRPDGRGAVLYSRIREVL